MGGYLGAMQERSGDGGNLIEIPAFGYFTFPTLWLLGCLCGLVIVFLDVYEGRGEEIIFCASYFTMYNL